MAIAAIQLAASLVLAGTPAPRANAQQPNTKLSVVTPYMMYSNHQQTLDG